MSQKLQNTADSVVDALRVMVVDRPLLLPMSAVAEVVRGCFVMTRDSDPEWLHGWLQWREQQIPLVAFEHMLGSAKGIHTGTVNALVVNSLGRADGLDFYAFLLSDLPQPARITESSDLFGVDTQNPGLYQLMEVSLGGDQLTIPDLQGLEKFLRASL